MAKRAVWKQGGVVSLKLRDDLFTLAQMLNSPVMRFYKVKSQDGRWNNVDLNDVEPLFSVFVAREVLRKLTDRKVEDGSVKPSPMASERYWIKPNVNYGGGFAFRGGRLIDIGTAGGISTSEAPVVKPNLTVEHDRDIIEKHELTNMWGSQDLKERLLRFFDTGDGRDALKQQVFPDLG